MKHFFFSSWHRIVHEFKMREGKKNTSLLFYKTTPLNTQMRENTMIIHSQTVALKCRCCFTVFIPSKSFAHQFDSNLWRSIANNKCSVNNKNCFQFPSTVSCKLHCLFYVCAELFGWEQFCCEIQTAICSRHSFELICLVCFVLFSTYATARQVWIKTHTCTSVVLHNKMQFAFSSNCFTHNWLNSIYLECNVHKIIDCVIIYEAFRLSLVFSKSNQRSFELQFEEDG